jgi:hypothetical protein
MSTMEHPMKTLPSLLLAVALITAASTAVSAYSFNPPDASVKLHGKLTFTPNEGNGQPFSCGITTDLKTKRNLITAVKFTSGNCQGLDFTGLPWGAVPLTANSGEIFGGRFSSGNGACVEDFNTFEVNGSGIWTLAAGQCMSGTLTSHPATTIVP